MSAPAGLTRPTRNIPGIRRRRRTKERFVRPKGGRGADALTYLVFLATLIFFGGPLLWILSLSIKTAAEVNDPSLRLIPQDPTLENYTQVLSTAQFPTFLINSAKLSVGGALGAMIVAAPAAYAFSRDKFRGKTVALIAVLALQMIAPLVLAVPLYRYFARIDVLDSHLSTTMVYIAILMPLATWMLKGFFDEIPKELDEAAMVDGANRFQAFYKVVMPVALPGVTAVFLLMAILAWGEFVIPYILLSEPSLLPVSVGILNFQGTYATTSVHILAAGGVMAMLPAIAIFVAMQRFIVGALTGAVKG
jgi:multiple sugar transport system permease protein